ncbi:MAG TPA: hypothetical protein VLH38_00850, partial [Patescibacteria group bacterium]|nr:hypothetical protein [Patescibacteria group bacterium]
MKVPEFVKRVGWVTLVVFTLVIVVYVLCKINVTNPGLPTPLLRLAKDILGAKPQLEFITDLSVFLGVILAMAVPLGIDIVQKISQFYAGSRIIRERLLREKQMQWMLPLYLVTILLSLVSRFFFIEDTTHPELQRAVCYVLLILLFSGLIIFAWYLNRLYFYTLDPKGLKQEIENRLTGSIDKRKQPDYLDLIEAYGDLIVSETRSSNLKTVMDESLPFVEAKIKQIVPKGDLEDAEKFILRQEFYEVSNRGKKQKSEGKPVTNDTTEEAAADSIIAGVDEKKVDWEQEARFRLYFSPDRYMLVYLSTIQQIIRVHQEGLRTGNDELTSQAVYSLVRILDYFSKQEERGFYIELLLRRLYEIARQAAKANDRSMYAAASQWYTTVAFDKLGTDKEEFQLDYLVTFNQALYSTLKFIIDDNYKTLFAAFVSYLVDGLHEPYRSNTVWELG